MKYPARMISVVVPTFNEATTIERTLGGLQALRRAGHEVIVVDGLSDDETLVRARPLADKVLGATRGRASQMNAGARIAQGDVLWFLHADCLSPMDVDNLILNALKKKDAVWGRFDVCLSGSGLLYRIIEFMMNSRSRITGIATGDQGIFVTQNMFKQAGGFPDIPLMEDIAFSKRLRAYGRPVCLQHKLTTSSRRWERRGVWHTILMMWRLRLAYALGVNPQKLARLYR